MSTLLSIDFDYFFPNPMLSPHAKGDIGLYDWGHRESPLFEGPMIWNQRAAAFMSRGKALPGLSREKQGFWERFRFTEDATLYVADSHAYAAILASQEVVTEVWNFDAHHDAGYGSNAATDFIACDNWLKVCHDDMGITCHVRYPLWNPDGGSQVVAPAWADARAYDPDETLPEFDLVFVCRSPAWVPTWHDQSFLHLVYGAGLDLEDIGDNPDHLQHPMIPRPFNREELKEIADQMRVYTEIIRSQGLPA